MGLNRTYGVAALFAGGLAALSSGGAIDGARAAEAAVRRPLARPRPAHVASRPLTIRRRVRPVAIAAAPPITYEVPLHGWNDTRLYYFGPFRTGGQVFYGDQAGNPITRGNAGLGMIEGYGGARGGFGGPHFDSVGGFHDGLGPDAKIDADYASGSLSRPDYGDVVPRYPSVAARLANLDRGVVPRGASVTLASARPASARATLAQSEAAKAAFAAPMRRNGPEDPLGFGNLPGAGFDDDAF